MALSFHESDINDVHDFDNNVFSIFYTDMWHVFDSGDAAPRSSQAPHLTSMYNNIVSYYQEYQREGLVHTLRQPTGRQSGV